MKIDVCSDLHVDVHAQREMHITQHDESIRPHLFWDSLKNEDSTGLIIAGDTSNNITTTIEVIDEAKEFYEFIFVVDGNHEHYDEKTSIFDNVEKLAEYYKDDKKVFVLEPSKIIKIDNIAILGACGWYDWKGLEDKGISRHIAKKVWSKYSNDSITPNFGGDSPDNVAIQHAAALMNNVNALQHDDTIDHILMVTHTSPIAELMYWHPWDHSWNELTPSYMNSEMANVINADINNKIRYWVYGHTHNRKETVYKNITFINNARGYPRESNNWFLAQIEI